MSTYKIGRDFEEEALIYLEKRFKNVIWLSKGNSSTFDFRCDDSFGKVLYGDAKVVSGKLKPSLSYSQRNADFVIAKINGTIKFILKKDFKEQILIKKTQLISLYPDEDLYEKLAKLAKEEHRSLNNFVLSILIKYVRTNK